MCEGIQYDPQKKEGEMVYTLCTVYMYKVRYNQPTEYT